MYIIRNLLRYIIKTQFCISSLRKRYNLRLMIYAYGDDIPLLSQWIKKEVTFGRQKLLLFLAGVAGYSPRAKILVLFAMQASLQLFEDECAPAHLSMPCSKVELPPSTKRANREGWLFLLAGVAGFEPADRGVKVLCLTAWRYPCVAIRV